MKLYKYCILFLGGLLCGITQLMAQPNAPAPAQSEPIVLQGATIHTGTGQVIENGSVAFDQGILTYVGPSSGFRPEAGKTYQEVEVNGSHIYPGLILLNTTLGLVEIGAVNATRDQEETGEFNPNARSIIAYNTDSELLPTMRQNGILMAQPTPQGGLVSGTSSFVQLDAWNWEDAVIKTDIGIHMHWPSRFFRPRWWLGETNPRKNKNYEEQVRIIRKALADGKSYASSKDPSPKNVMLEAMRGLYDRSKTLFFHTDRSRAALEGIQILKSYGVEKIALIGGQEAMYIKDYLRENQIPVVIENTHRLPGLNDHGVDTPFRLPRELVKAGVQVALSSDEDNPMNNRNLPFHAGTTVAYGLEKEEALALITSVPAKILGVFDQVGSLEKGKHATLVVSKGDLLDMRSNQVSHAFIQGRETSLETRHTRLYQKFKGKYDTDK